LSLIETKAPPRRRQMGIECITCHDPHQTNGYPAQLRYPLASTNDYFMPTNGVFASLLQSQDQRLRPMPQ
jgi:hypothetical protein